jgi:hypothetical protein
MIHRFAGVECASGSGIVKLTPVFVLPIFFVEAWSFPEA